MLSPDRNRIGLLVGSWQLELCCPRRSCGAAGETNLSRVLCLSRRERATFSQSPALCGICRTHCAPDGFPHSIAYHGGGALSSATRTTVSYQPVASHFIRTPKSAGSSPGILTAGHHTGVAAGKRWAGVQTTRQRQNRL